MQTNIQESTVVAQALQILVEKQDTKLPVTLAKVLTPVIAELGILTVIHPTTNDPVLISSTKGAVAVWFNF